jgi:hypothetical protein
MTALACNREHGLADPPPVGNLLPPAAIGESLRARVADRKDASSILRDP